MRINNRNIALGADTLTWRGRTYELAGASATYSTQRRGIPLLSRRTVTTVTITGQGWTITGEAKGFGWETPQRFVTKVNERASASGGD